jgi:hypothetical protein
MTREQRTAQWRTLVDEQAASGLSAAAFCREHGISLQRFYGWRRRFREQQSVEKSASFVELAPCCDQPGRVGIAHRNVVRITCYCLNGAQVTALKRFWWAKRTLQLMTVKGLI